MTPKPIPSSPPKASIPLPADTPYEGFRTRGSIAQVYLRGQLAAENGAPKLGPAGVYIPRKPGML